MRKLFLVLCLLLSIDGFSATINKSYNRTIAGASVNVDGVTGIELYKSNASNAASYGYSMLKDGAEWTVPTGKTFKIRAMRIYQSTAVAHSVGLGYAVYTSYTGFTGIAGATYYTAINGTSSYYFGSTPATANLIFEAQTPNFSVPTGNNVLVNLPAANSWAIVIGELE